MELSSPTTRSEAGLHLPEGAGWFTRCKVGFRALRVLAKQKDDSVAAPLFNVAVDGEVFARLAAELATTVDGRELLRERPSLDSGAIGLTALSELPAGSLGYELARYYETNRIKPFESPYVVRSDVDYLAKRYRETHDVVHVLTGYGTDAQSEMELQAFVLGNLGLRQCVAILTFAALFRTDGLPPIWKYGRRLRAAFQRGRRCGDILAPRYERYFSTPVEEARRALELDR